jgi:hypothetical protein
LIEAGVLIDIIDDKKMTALIIAAYRGATEIA